MKINFKHSYSLKYIKIASVLLLFFVFRIVTSENYSFTNFSNLYSLFAILGSLLIYTIQRKYKYLTIENESIKKNISFKKAIKLNEIVEIKKFAGDYTLITKSESFEINTKIIDIEELNRLDNVLNKTVLHKKH